MTFEQAKVTETEFFKSRPELASLKPSQKGIDALMDRLVSLQRKMVLDYRFEFKDKLSVKLREMEERLRTMEKPCIND